MIEAVKKLRFKYEKRNLTERVEISNKYVTSTYEYIVVKVFKFVQSIESVRIFVTRVLRLKRFQRP